MSSLTPAEQVYAIKTWRYLRLAMIVFIVGLGVSLAYERANAPGCWQTSISAYYYTPVHGFFVGMLVAVGTCLICIKGSTDVEDALLNLAGMFAPVVALVPTPNPGHCFSIAGPAENRDANISNNVFALLVAGGVAIAILVGIVLAARFSDKVALPKPPALVAFALITVVWLVALITFHTNHDEFVDKAHYTAAIALFVCFLGVVILNAIEYGAKHHRLWIIDRYGLVAVAMVLDVIVWGAAGLAGFDYWVIWIEATLIGFFGLFWAIQTRELWGEGVR